MVCSSIIAIIELNASVDERNYVRLDIKSAWHDLAAIIPSILDSVQYKIYTWLVGISAGYQISAIKPEFIPEFLQPIMLQLHSISWLESITAWGVIMLAVERTFAAIIRVNQWRRERQLAKRRESVSK